MKKLTKWQKKLTKVQREHCKERELTSLAAVKESVLFQETTPLVCWTCVGIGRDLGIKFELKEFHKAREGGEV